MERNNYESNYELQYFANERNECVKYCSQHEKIKSISSVPYNLLFIYSMQKAGNDAIDIFASEDMEDITGTGYLVLKHSHVYNKTIYHT